jgi:chromosomal replication initiation ATPase DnaA
MAGTPWDAVLDQLRARLASEDFRHWFSDTSYASDSGDQITVWVPTEPIKRHLNTHYRELVAEALAAIDRPRAHVRFVVSGVSEDEDDEGD